MTRIHSNHSCETELRNAALKVTPARLGVLEALEGTNVPLDVNALTTYLKKHNIKADKVTVFRIINTLTKKGLAKPIQLNEGKFRYEYGPKADHHHFICENCGMIEDISDCSIDVFEKEITKRKKLLVKRHSLEFFGLCPNCQK